MNIVAIIQARMGSTRLPGKALIDLAGEPMLARVVRRVQRAQSIGTVVVATTSHPADDTIAQLCASRAWPCARGSEDDVLDRTYQAAVTHQADVVVRITSDCPLIEPAVIDQVVDEFLARQPAVAYASNVQAPRTFPRGLDTEVIRFDALARAWREDTNPAWREHVTPYIYRHPESFACHGVVSDRDLSTMRWTVDTPEDLEFVRCIYAHFGDDSFSWLDVLALLEQRPDWLDINRAIEQKVV